MPFEVVRFGETLVRTVGTLFLAVFGAGLCGFLAYIWRPVFRRKKPLTPPRP
jgi:hypothetical protein